MQHFANYNKLVTAIRSAFPPSLSLSLSCVGFFRLFFFLSVCTQTLEDSIEGSFCYMDHTSKFSSPTVRCPEVTSADVQHKLQMSLTNVVYGDELGPYLARKPDTLGTTERWFWSRAICRFWQDWVSIFTSLLTVREFP